MKILHFVSDRSGIFMYRCYFPGITIQEKTEHNVLYSRSCNIGHPHDLADLNWADILIFNRQYTPAVYECAKYAKMLGKKVVFEIDDNWMHLNKDNPFYAGMKDNKQILEGMKKMCQLADAITVTTTPLKKAMREFTGNKKIYLLQNHICDYYFKFHTVQQEKKPGRINLFWAGAQNHLNSIRVLKEPIKEIMSKYDNVDFYMVGSNYMNEFPFMKRERMFYVPWTDIERYPNSFTFGDIALAPICPDKGFYQCKSNIRIQEASWYGMPVVASNLYEYGKTIKHDKTGYLANDSADWVKYLSILIENSWVRDRIGMKAKEWADKNVIENNYQKYVQAYSEILNG